MPLSAYTATCGTRDDSFRSQVDSPKKDGFGKFLVSY